MENFTCMKIVQSRYKQQISAIEIPFLSKMNPSLTNVFHSENIHKQIQ